MSEESPSDRILTGDDRERGSQADQEKAPDPNIVDWDGPDDPSNPLNWSISKKTTTISMVSFLTLLSPLGSTIISPATDLLMEEFKSTNGSLGAFVTSVYLIGYTCGPLFIAPLSELYGRNILYHLCNWFVVIFTIACAVAPNLGSLIAFRFLVGIGASCPMTLGGGSIADMIRPERRGLAMSVWVLGPLFGPSVGPIIAGYMSQDLSWRWCFWLMAIVAGAASALSFFALHESWAYTILDRKTQRLRKETGNPDLRSALDERQEPKALFMTSIVRPMKMLFMFPTVFLLSFYCGIIYSYLYLCFTTFPRVFEGQYGFSRGSSGLVYLGIGVGSFFGLIMCGALSDPVVRKLTKRNGGEPIPEYRLPAMVIGASLIPAGLFWYGWTAEHKNHYMLPIVGSGLLGCGTVIVFMTISTYLVDAYTKYAASALAANTVFRSTPGATLPLAGDSMYNALGVGWGTSVLGFIAVAFLPVPLVFMKFGQRIRESKLFQVEL